MIRTMARCLCLILSCFPTHLAASPASHAIGTVNLGIAVSLHPRMSLFDFQNLGFYKVPLGLSKEEFAMAVARTAVSTATKSLEKTIGELDTALAALTQQKQVVFQKMASTLPEDGACRAELAALDREADRIRREQQEAEYTLKHPELTTPGETRALLDDIEKEVMDIVRETGKAKRYDVVLNTTLPMPFGYPVTYTTGNEYGRGISSLDQQMMYALTANHDDMDQQQTKDERVSRWIQLTSHPEVQPLLPLKPWPLVIQGGESITAEVVRKLYERYKISSEIIEATDAAILEFETSPQLPSAKK